MSVIAIVGIVFGAILALGLLVVGQILSSKPGQGMAAILEGLAQTDMGKAVINNIVKT